MNTFNIKKIIVPVDFSETSMEAFTHAVYVAKLNNASITLVHVIEKMPSLESPIDYPISFESDSKTDEKTASTKSKKYLTELIEIAKKKDKIAINSVSAIGRVPEEIIAVSKKIKADIIIMGTHGVKGFREFMIGSNAFRVANQAQCPVLSIQKHTTKLGFKNILVPFRDKPHSREKVDYAIKIASIYGAAINVLGIDAENDTSKFKKIVKEAEQIKAIVEKHDLICNIKVVTTPYLAADILKYAAKKKNDLIVIMGDLDRMRISEYFMGPFSQQMVNHSTIPILSIRPTFNPDTIDLHGYGW